MLFFKTDIYSNFLSVNKLKNKLSLLFRLCDYSIISEYFCSFMSIQTKHANNIFILLSRCICKLFHFGFVSQNLKWDWLRINLHKRKMLADRVKQIIIIQCRIDLCDELLEAITFLLVTAEYDCPD